jgi:Flp pilus assembly pilin Flp
LQNEYAKFNLSVQKGGFVNKQHSLNNPYGSYYYLRNAQNDIVKLIDNSGATVVEYAHLNSDLAAVEVGFLGQTAVNLGFTRVHTRKE